MSNNPYQPGPSNSGFPGKPVPAGKPKNYLVESILVTICCCLPLGIPAIVFAAQVDGKFNQGDYAGANDAAGKAKMFCLLALVLGLVVNVIAIGFQLVAISLAP